MLISRSIIFRAAWATARRDAVKAGRTAREMFPAALRDAWAATREMPKTDGMLPAMILCLLDVGILGRRQREEYPELQGWGWATPSPYRMGHTGGSCAVRRVRPQPFYMAGR